MSKKKSSVMKYIAFQKHQKSMTVIAKSEKKKRPEYCRPNEKKRRTIELKRVNITGRHETASIRACGVFAAWLQEFSCRTLTVISVSGIG